MHTTPQDARDFVNKVGRKKSRMRKRLEGGAAVAGVLFIFWFMGKLASRNPTVETDTASTGKTCVPDPLRGSCSTNPQVAIMNLDRSIQVREVGLATICYKEPIEDAVFSPVEGAWTSVSYLEDSDKKCVEIRRTGR